MKENKPMELNELYASKKGAAKGKQELTAVLEVRGGAVPRDEE